MPDHEQRPGGQGPGAVCPLEGTELIVVAGVTESGHGSGHLEPGDLVDLIDQRAVTTHDLGSPISTFFGRRLTALVWDGVLRGGQGATQTYVKPGLLEHFAHGGYWPFFAWVKLALGPGPVPVTGSMDHGDLQRTATATPR